MALSYIDSCVLISAFNGKPDIAAKASAVLNDPTLKFASSEFVKLELLMKPAHFGFTKETAFYEAFFQKVHVNELISQDLIDAAFLEGKAAGLSAGDAIHVAAAIRLKCDELVTAEAHHSAIHKAKSIPIRSIR